MDGATITFATLRHCAGVSATWSHPRIDTRAGGFGPVHPANDANASVDTNATRTDRKGDAGTRPGSVGGALASSGRAGRDTHQRPARGAARPRIRASPRGLEQTEGPPPDLPARPVLARGGVPDGGA